MGALVVDTTAAQTRPASNKATGPFNKGTVYVNAFGEGSGTWSAIFNVAPVAPTGVIGTAKQYTVSNTAPMTDADYQTGVQNFIAWWSSFSGTVLRVKGSVEG